jgi:hypothetical protein
MSPGARALGLILLFAAFQLAGYVYLRWGGNR